MPIQWEVDDTLAIADLQAKGDLMMSAILGAVGSLGQQLLERVQGKLSGELLNRGTGELYDSVQLQAAAFVDQVCQTSVGIDDNGQASYIVAYVHEYGGQGYYDIYPLGETFDIAGVTKKGKISPHSDPEGAAAQEGRLPHSLAWSGPNGMVFARHVWHPPATEKAYLRTSLAEMEALIADEIETAIAGVMNA